MTGPPNHLDNENIPRSKEGTKQELFELTENRRRARLDFSGQSGYRSGAMLSVIVWSNGEPDALARTLGALVPAVAEGAIARAVAIGRLDGDAIAAVIDAAGCVAMAGECVAQAAARVAFSPWLLLIRAGDVPQAGWLEEARRFFALSRPGHAALVRAGSGFVRTGLVRFAVAAPDAAIVPARTAARISPGEAGPVPASALAGRRTLFASRLG
jgi:hypothetical protein